MIDQTVLFVAYLRTSGSALSVVLLDVEGMLVVIFLERVRTAYTFEFALSILQYFSFATYRYKEGHTIEHWKDTQHCCSVDLATQRVWDYEGDNYVHRLNQSRADGKSVMVNSNCMSHGGECATCGDGEDSEIAGALFNSKVEAVFI